ncbi:MAG: T9SS type A sorting domain-containing protein, partial [Candidatus Zixiibacteriota bacterium]
DDVDGVGDLCDACPDDTLNDPDSDGICGLSDNCLDTPNADQVDSDSDGIGDVCDVCAGYDDKLDADGDLLADGCDNCPNTPNVDQADRDSDGVGDVCDICPDGPEGACETVCTGAGDVDFDGSVDAADRAYLGDYLYLGGPPPPNPINADCDGYAGISLRDMLYLKASLDSPGVPLSCPPGPASYPTPDSTIRLFYPDYVDSFATQVEVPITLISSVDVLAFNFPLQIRIGETTIPTIDSIKVSSYFQSLTEGTWLFTPDMVYRTDAATGTVLISAASHYGGTPLMHGAVSLVALYLTIPPSSAKRALNIAWGEMSPIQSLELPYLDEILDPVVISPGDLGSFEKSGAATDDFLPQFLPMLAGSNCCIGARGDVDGDGKNGRLSDITCLIDHVYISGKPLLCPDEGNIDGDPEGKITLNDITALIDYVYVSHNAPLECGQFTATTAARVSATEAVSLSCRYVDESTIVILESDVDLRGIHLELPDQTAPGIEQLVDDVTMFDRKTEEGHTLIGLFDPKGQSVIPAGRHELVRIPGKHGLSDALASDMNLRVIYPKFGEEIELPDEFHLSQNYPNPFNPVTEIAFTLPAATEWRLTIYNVLGQTVASWSEQSPAGTHTVTWDAHEYSSGVYFYRLTAGPFTETKKMLLLK